MAYGRFVDGTVVSVDGETVRSELEKMLLSIFGLYAIDRKLKCCRRLYFIGPTSPFKYAFILILSHGFGVCVSRIFGQI